MVDLRPLLFINFLLLMLMITAGFVPVDKAQQVVKDEVPETWVDTDDEAQVEQTAKTEKSEKQNQMDAELAELNANLDNIFAGSSKAKDIEVEVGDAIFADEVPKDIGFEQAKPAKQKISAEEALKNLGDATASANNQVTQPAPRPAPTPTPKVVPKESVVVAYSSKPKPEPVKTGKLVIRSNVHDDTVLINGKPYGPTRLDVELTPGTYAVEVAKEGFESWSAQIDVRRGQTKKLNARLAKYTNVDYKNGTWLNDIITGEGTYDEDGKLEYHGSFVNGKFHGVGSVRYETGMRYQGDWFEGKMQGTGTLTTPEGDVYIGQLENDQFNGEGTLTKATGDIYTGYWIDGVLNGQGTLTTKDGLLFVGGFSDNQFHGTGSLTYPDGGHYEGSFANGLYHGKGIETYPNGKRYEGQFVEGLYHGKGEILNPNGSMINGTFKNGEPYGKATLTTPEGEVFTARASEPGVCYRLKSYRATECPEMEGW